MPKLRRVIASAVLLLGVLVAIPIGAHPDDEFCIPGEGSLDPELCAALAELDNPNAEFVPVERAAPTIERSHLGTVSLYVRNGVRHILPAGLDHILFVLALFLTSTRLRALVIQISAFTAAHTMTLGLAATGIFAPPANVVEPLIAATIAFVAIENLFVRDMPGWRPVLVFAFGLLHGLGFASFFAQQGFPPGHFWSALIGFNLGVEIGQLGIVLLAYLIAARVLRRTVRFAADRNYRRYIVLPGSAIIGGMGLVWMVQRIVGF